MKRIRAHYVPQFYLKNFGDRIYQYDKETDKVNPSTPKNVAFQYGFYADSDDTAPKLEYAMSQIEGSASAVISNIIEAESVAGLSDDDMVKLCAFVAFQFSRTPEYRYWWQDINRNFRDGLERIGVANQYNAEEEAHPKTEHLASMLGYIERAGPYFLQMRLYLNKNDTAVPLWTSDNPVVRHNDLTDKLGLSSPGVCYYLPLTPKILLSLHNGTDMDLLYDAARGPGISEEQWISARDEIMESGLEEANVIHANHLQTRFSTRFVFSNGQDFHMIKEFLAADGDYRNRHAPQTGQPDGRERGGGAARLEPLHHNLQNALWQYEAALRETDARRAFVLLYDSLEQATNLSWPGDQSGEEFDGKVRKLLDDPELPVDVLRRLRDNIMRDERAGKHADMADMGERVDTLRQITARMILFKRNELEARANTRRSAR